MTQGGDDRFDAGFDDEPGDLPSIGLGAGRSSTVDARLLTTYLERPSPWRRIVWLGIGLLLTAAVAQEAAGMYYDRRLSAVVNEVAGRDDLEVRCRRVWDELLHIRANPGFVQWGSTTANLQFPVCLDAARWAGDPDDVDKRVAIMVLTHELAHLAGHYDESTTECVAMWAVPRTAVALGGTVEEGEAVANWYAVAHNPRLRPDYQAPGCLSGQRPVSALLR